MAKPLSRRSLVQNLTLIPQGLLLGCTQASRPFARLLWLSGSERGRALDPFRGTTEDTSGRVTSYGDIILRGVSTDGRWLILTSPELAFSLQNRWPIFAVDLVSAKVLWAIRGGFLRVPDVRCHSTGKVCWIRSEGANRKYQFTAFDFSCSGGIVKQFAAGGSVDSRQRGFGVLRDSVIYSEEGNVVLQSPDDRPSESVMPGHDVSAPDSCAKISVWRSNGEVSIWSWPELRISVRVPGEFNDAGEWSCDGRFLLLSKLIDPRGGLLLRSEPLCLFDTETGELKSLGHHRIMIGSRALRWVSALPPEAVGFSLESVDRAIRGLCGRK